MHEYESVQNMAVYKTVFAFGIISIVCGITIVTTWIQLNHGCPEFQYSHFRYNSEPRYKAVNFRIAFGVTLIFEGLFGLIASYSDFKSGCGILWLILKITTGIMNCVYLAVSVQDRSFETDTCMCRNQTTFECTEFPDFCCQTRFNVSGGAMLPGDILVQRGHIHCGSGLVSMVGWILILCFVIEGFLFVTYYHLHLLLFDCINYQQ